MGGRLGLHRTQLRCRVECYGQGKVHKDILKKLNIAECEHAPGIPCILFVYKVSRQNEDLRNALQWVRESQINMEDIRAVFLLHKVSGKLKKMAQKIEIEQKIFATDTQVVQVSWNENHKRKWKEIQPGFNRSKLKNSVNPERSS